MADTLTAVQHPESYYPTWMRRKGANVEYSDNWPNCTSHTGEMLIKLGHHTQGLARK